MTIIQPRDELAPVLAEARRRGHTIGFANGCFDLVHVGHVRYLADAKRHCDILVLALNDDDSVRRLKGPGRPLVPLVERLEVAAAFRFVDYVTWFPEDTVETTLRLLNPHIQFKGTDYTPDTVPERHVMAELGGTVMIAGDPKDHSTTDLIGRMEDPT